MRVSAEHLRRKSLAAHNACQLTDLGKRRMGSPRPLAGQPLGTYDSDGIGGAKRSGPPMGDTAGPLNAPTIQNPGTPGTMRIIGRPAGLLSTLTIISSEGRDLFGTPFRDPDGHYGTLTGWVNAN